VDLSMEMAPAGCPRGRTMLVVGVHDRVAALADGSAEGEPQVRQASSYEACSKKLKIRAGMETESRLLLVCTCFVGWYAAEKATQATKPVGCGSMATRHGAIRAGQEKGVNGRITAGVAKWPRKVKYDSTASVVVQHDRP
jgi:hypothetical protein